MPWLYENKNSLVALNGAKPDFADSQLTIRGVVRENQSAFYDLDDWPGYQIYIFGEQQSDYLIQKLTNMIDFNVSQLSRAHFAWPIDVIVDNSNVIIGYVVNKVLNTTSLLNILRSVDSISYEQKLCIAKNICTALDIFHSQNLIFGCLNLSSILVDIRTCRVFLDPFLNAQFTDVKGNTFFCSHYNIEYISPEMQDYLGSGSQLDDALPNDLIVYADGNIEQKIALPFTKNDDLFALGVILFALFNNNQHPLSCYIGGKEAIDILNPQSNYPSSNPHIASLMSHTSPKTSILRRTIGIFKYRLFWYRWKGAGSIYDSCYIYANRGRNNRPSSSDWYDLSDKKLRSFRMRLNRLRQRFKNKSNVLMGAGDDAATKDEFRNVVVEQYPADLIGSESISTPRVFWGTTFIYTISFILCVISASLVFGLYSVNFIWSVFGTLIGYFIINFFISKNRSNSGYCYKNYATSILSTSLLTLLIGFIAGGFW